MATNSLLRGMQAATNATRTENGAVTRKSTLSDLYDLFALGGSYRKRSNDDCIVLFKNAYAENPTYAMKCLFYLRNIRGGQGERRFFRVVMNWLADEHPDAVRRNIENIPFFGRWDDLYSLYDTKCWDDAMVLIGNQFALDTRSKTPSLMAKWMKSENTSSRESRMLGAVTRKALGLSPREYRVALSALRKKINIVERLMSQDMWDKIEFDKLPSQAGIRYKNAFARHDVTKAHYMRFMTSKETKVNAGSLAPYEVVEKAIGSYGRGVTGVERLAVNKYWENLKDYFNKATLNALCMVDTSGSMRGTPINVAISLGMYCAERGKGPFANHYISFSSQPQLIRVEGSDFVDKVQRIYRTNLCQNTNIEAAFDLVLNTAISNRLRNDDMPKNIIVISDMEFDEATSNNMYWNKQMNASRMNSGNCETLMEGISRRFRAAGYVMPKLIFWNVDARKNNIPMKSGKNVTFVSGFSASTFSLLLSGKTGYDLMMDALNDKMYERVR